MADPYQRHQMALLKVSDNVYQLALQQDSAETREERLRRAIELKCNAQLQYRLAMDMYKRILKEEGNLLDNINLDDIQRQLDEDNPDCPWLDKEPSWHEKQCEKEEYQADMEEE